MKKKICIIGTGGFGREVLCCVIDIIGHTDRNINEFVSFMVSDQYFKESEIMGVGVIKQSQFDPEKYETVVAIGEPDSRKKMVESLPLNTAFAKLIHPSATVSTWVKIGEGSIITAGCILTSNIKLGNHTHLNLNTTIGHDCIIGDYFTTAPGANVSGSCNFGNNIYLGTGSAIKQNIHICSDVTIGMGAIVVKNITEAGTYVGSPAIKVNRDN